MAAASAAATHVPAPLTRLVTTHDPSKFNADGEPVAIFHPRSGPAEWKQISPSVCFSLIHTTSESPDLNGDADIAAHDQLVKDGNLVLSKPGTVCRMVEWAPAGAEEPASTDDSELQDAMNSFMHRTQSLDYGILVMGEIECILDSGEKRTMKVGDVCVQRATMHLTEHARMVFVLVGCQELEADTPSGKKILGNKYPGAEKAEELLRTNAH